MAQKPLDPKVKERYAYLVGVGLTGEGVAGAVKISTATGELGALCVLGRSRKTSTVQGSWSSRWWG